MLAGATTATETPATGATIATATATSDGVPLYLEVLKFLLWIFYIFVVRKGLIVNISLTDYDIFEVLLEHICFVVL